MRILEKIAKNNLLIPIAIADLIEPLMACKTIHPSDEYCKKIKILLKLNL
jgi:hypothetical protein